MTSISADRLAELVVSALERTAFILAEPTEPPPRDEPCRAAMIQYSGPGRGRVVLSAADGLVRCLAAGLLGVEPDDVDLDAHGDDALRELANVVGGSIITELGGDHCRYSLGLPRTLAATDGRAAPPGAVESCGCCLDCEGQLLSVSWHAEAAAPAKAA